jgi:hypothetical protein
LVTVEGFGKNTGNRGFSNPTRSNKEISLRKLLRANGILKRLDNSTLTNDILESLGAIFSGKDTIAHDDRVKIGNEN